MKSFYLKIGNLKVSNIKFAITKEQQRVGLMSTAYPPVITIFPYKEAQIRKFWMKNVGLPLDIIFCNAGKVVCICVGKPYIENKLIGSDDKPSDLVVEAMGGFCAYNNIQVGDSISIKYDKSNLSKFLKN